MITSSEALQLGGLRIAVGDARRNLAYHRTLVEGIEQELVKAERQFSTYLEALLENDNESGIRA